jgi:hypothetical protein
MGYADAAMMQQAQDIAMKQAAMGFANEQKLRDLSPIDQAFERVAKNLAALEHEVLQLSDRLESVLKCEEGETAKQPGSIPSFSCGLEGRLMCLEETARRIGLGVESLNRRLCL